MDTNTEKSWLEVEMDESVTLLMNSRNERKNRLLNQNLRVICLSFCHTEAAIYAVL